MNNTKALLQIFNIFHIIGNADTIKTNYTFNNVNENKQLCVNSDKNINLADASASTSIIFSAAYNIYMFNRIAFGGSYSKFIAVNLPDLNKREFYMLFTLVVFTVTLGVYNAPIMDGINYSVTTLIYNTDWTMCIIPMLICVCQDRCKYYNVFNSLDFTQQIQLFVWNFIHTCLSVVKTVCAWFFSVYNGSYLHASVNKSIEDIRHVIESSSLENILRYTLMLDFKGIVFLLLSVICALAVIFICIYNAIYKTEVKFNLLSKIIICIKYIFAYPIKFIFVITFVCINMATFRSCAYSLLNLEHGNYLINELLIVIFSPLSLIMAYCADRIYNRCYSVKPKDMYVNKAPLNDFVVRNLNLSFLVSLFLITSIGSIFIRPTLILLTTYIINNLPNEVYCITRIFLEFLINNSIFIILSGLTISKIIKPIIILNNLASINNTRPVMATCKSGFSGYVSRLMITLTAASVGDSSKPDTLREWQLIDTNLDKVPNEIRMQIWQNYQELLINKSQQLITSIFDDFNRLQTMTRHIAIMPKNPNMSNWACSEEIKIRDHNIEVANNKQARVLDYFNLCNSLDLKIRDLITITSSSRAAFCGINKIIPQISEKRGFVNPPYLLSPNNRFVTREWTQLEPYGNRFDTVLDLIKQSDSYKNWIKTCRVQSRPGREVTQLFWSWPDKARPLAP